MKKIIIALGLLSLILSPRSVNAADYYVSPQGSDSNQGTQSNPFRSVLKARDAVRAKIKAGLNDNIRVFLRGGTYQLSTPLEFNSADSGTDQYFITWQGFPGEKAILSGGISLPKTWIRDSGSVWRLSVPGMNFKSLFQDGSRLLRARFPNSGSYMRITAFNSDRTQLIFNQTIPGLSDWSASTGAELITLYNWEIGRTPIIQSKNNPFNGVVTVGSVGVPTAAGGQLTAKIDDAVYVEGAKALLDSPGEWYLDTLSGILYYFAAAGENPNTKEFVAANLTSILKVKGTEAQPVKSLNFQAISFEYADWTIPPLGYDGMQATFYFPSKTTHAVSTPLAATVLIEYANNVRFEGNSFRHFGLDGVAIGTNTKNMTIDRNSFGDIGGNCLDLGWSAQKGFYKNWPLIGNVPDNINVTNNTVSGCGKVFLGGIGISATGIRNSKITHNQVSNLNYTGIALMAGPPKIPPFQENVAVTANRIFNVMKLLSDGGGIYTWGQTPNGLINANLIYDINYGGVVESNSLINNGLFLDENTSMLTVKNNIVYNSVGPAIRTNHTAADNVIGTNYFNVSPGMPGYPSSIANQAGPLPANATPSVTASSLQGDLNNSGNVDIFDYNLLVSNFGNPYTIFDYNTLLSNFGK